MADGASMTERSIRVSMLQLGVPEGESPEERLERVAAMAAEEAQHADLLVLPELWMTGYFAFDRYAAEAIALDGEVIGRFGEIARRGSVHVVAGTFVERGPDGLTNCAVMLDPNGDVAHTYRKMHLFGYGSEEAKILVPGRTANVVSTPIGTLATSTCYDLRFPELFRVFVEAGAEVIIIPAAWPKARVAHWRLLLQARAVENLAVVIGCNGAGVQSGVELGGASMIVGPWGEVIAEAGDAPQVLRATVDLGEVTRVREEFPALTHRRIGIAAPSGAQPAA